MSAAPDRRRFVGSSEVASLFYAWRLPDGAVAYRHLFEPAPAGAQLLGCVSRHKTGHRLWAEKAGRLEPEALSGDPLDAGRFLEPAVAAWAAEKFGMRLRKVRRYIRHPLVAGMGASLDFETVDAGRVPVEIKVVEAGTFRELWQADGDEVSAPPINLTLQLQHQLCCAGRDFGWIVVYVAGRGHRLLRGRIAAHEPTFTKVERAVDAFWSAIDTRRAPDACHDWDTTARLYAAAGDTVADLSADNEAPSLCAEYLAARAAADAAGDRLDRAKAALATKLGPATRAVCTGYRIGWPVVSRKAAVREIPAATYRGAITVKETTG